MRIFPGTTRQFGSRKGGKEEKGEERECGDNTLRGNNWRAELRIFPGPKGGPTRQFGWQGAQGRVFASERNEKAPPLAAPTCRQTELILPPSSQAPTHPPWYMRLALSALEPTLIQTRRMET